jgi:hypothetical protein
MPRIPQSFRITGEPHLKVVTNLRGNEVQGSRERQNDLLVSTEIISPVRHLLEQGPKALIAFAIRPSASDKMAQSQNSTI